MNINKVLAVLALTAATAAVSSATALNCGSLPGSQDPTLNTTVGITSNNVCSVTGSVATFSNFLTEWNGTAQSGIAFIQTSSTKVIGNEVYLGFQLSTPSLTGDLLLTYQASGIEGVDFSIQATPGQNGGSVIFGETVCSTPFGQNNSCTGTTLANIGGTSTGQLVTGAATWVGSFSTVYIKKDINFTGGASMSEFTNSQLIPEPMTLSLMGIGLIGLGLAGRKLRK